MSEAIRSEAILSEAVRIFDVDAVRCVYDPVPWAFAEQEHAAIDAHWATLLARKPALFNGEVLLLHRWAVEDGVFTGAYLRAEYKAFIAWRDFGHPDRTKWNCFAMAALRSADGAFLLGEMAPHTANGGSVYFAAGTPDPSDLVGTTVDLGGSVMRELAEETGLTAADVTLPGRWTVVHQGPRIALMRAVVSSLDAVALNRHIGAYLAREAEPELSRMHIVRRPGEPVEARMPLFQRAYLQHAL